MLFRMQNRQPFNEPTKLKTLMKSCASEISETACLNLTIADAQDLKRTFTDFKKNLALPRHQGRGVSRIGAMVIFNV